VPFVLIGVALVSVSACSRYIARERGTVLSIETPDLRGKGSTLCLANTVDAGSTYGARKGHQKVCWSGNLEGIVPRVGDCVVMQVEAETSYLRVTGGEGCVAP
jgi:hypothetical protein